MNEICPHPMRVNLTMIVSDRESEFDAVAELPTLFQQINERLAEAIIGQREVIRQICLGLFCRGHCILEGVPGLAKTMMIARIAEILDLNFKRIQFTPDLMPSDITGTEILEEEEGTGRRRMKFVKGPVFGNIILGDEINRTPPKTQSALLQAMQEYRVTIAGQDYPLERPFLVLGTQNPIEHEGTYPLPEAQLDRFMFKILVNYPSFEEEMLIAESTTRKETPPLKPLINRAMILDIQDAVREVLVGETVTRFAVQLVRRTRPKESDAPDWIRKSITWGAGPRACQALLLGAKAEALLHGRVHVALDDVRAVAKPVLRHRLSLHFRALSEGITPDALIDRLLTV